MLTVNTNFMSNIILSNFEFWLLTPSLQPTHDESPALPRTRTHA